MNRTDWLTDWVTCWTTAMAKSRLERNLRETSYENLLNQILLNQNFSVLPDLKKTCLEKLERNFSWEPSQSENPQWELLCLLERLLHHLKNIPILLIRPSEDGHTNQQWGDITGDPNPHISIIPMLCYVM